MQQKPLEDGGRGGDDLPVDQIIELLGQYQRREIVRQLRDAPGEEHSVDDVVAYLQAVERDRSGAAPGKDHLLSVFVHIHGPKLEEAGLIDYDLPSRDVRYYPDERVEELLDQIDEWVEEF